MCPSLLVLAEHPLDFSLTHPRLSTPGREAKVLLLVSLLQCPDQCLTLRGHLASLLGEIMWTADPGSGLEPQVIDELTLSDQPGCHPEERVIRRHCTLSYLLRPYIMLCQCDLVTHQVSGECSPLA